jgi:hypothetical protein
MISSCTMLEWILKTIWRYNSKRNKTVTSKNCVPDSVKDVINLLVLIPFKKCRSLVSTYFTNH